MCSEIIGQIILLSLYLSVELGASSFALHINALRPQLARGRSSLRVHQGYGDTDGRYPYVVSLVTKRHRVCTGSLIAPNWVLTAGHCVSPNVVAIQYGNMTVRPSESTTKRRIIKFIKPNAYTMDITVYYYYLKHDIALARVDGVAMSVYGSISSVDYTTLTGVEVEYAGFGATFQAPTKEEFIMDDRRPLQLGSGVLQRCHDDFGVGSNYGPFICVSSKCNHRGQRGLGGDSGGPLVNDGKIIGVFSYSGPMETEAYTPVSPFLGWIHDTMVNYTEE